MGDGFAIPCWTIEAGASPCSTHSPRPSLTIGLGDHRDHFDLQTGASDLNGVDAKKS